MGARDLDIRNGALLKEVHMHTSIVVLAHWLTFRSHPRTASSPESRTSALCTLRGADARPVNPSTTPDAPLPAPAHFTFRPHTPRAPRTLGRWWPQGVDLADACMSRSTPLP
ncbi:hypothetical protein MVEN_00677300 [Mycena venus]|uniref:Uncharacterized protein n=1 Tax=Mycena venus TaxID=2733690 RepID=A0A8H6YL86_9AGAR|nr:hypothetical protein MVEN_00677300 [Mycena venus]